ncbi:MAG: NADPH-dependent 7-cyano-7-deazaguanine reductase QueF [Aquimonas sp.]|nr:NADPH-dependent 7-cyano-7-deazaguanine reductase QueF [Aquimonas sp.]
MAIEPLNHAAETSTLGKPVTYGDHYDPGLLFPIPRARNRQALGINDAALPFRGVDIWNGYELSWLNLRGKPQVAVARFDVPAESPNLIESKSFKLYLNGFNQTRMASIQAVQQRLIDDLSHATGARIAVELIDLQALEGAALQALPGDCIDALDFDIDAFSNPDQHALQCADAIVDECLVSHLLKSNCPVTGQPDWASVQIAYQGPRLDREALLRYLIAFRQHNDFHEHCVERIWLDLWRQCRPTRLTVYARYTRRGGLDINPWRSSEPGQPDNSRGPRQ